MNTPVDLSLLRSEISKIVMHEFRMITLNRNMEKKQNYVTWLETAKLYT